MERQICTMVELRADEAATIRGGNPLAVVTLISGAFAAGFKFGYYDLAPRLFD